MYLGGNPPLQQTMYPGGTDRLARLTDDTLLLQKQGASAVNPGGFEIRGAQAFYVSNDCGQTWVLRSVIDPKCDLGTLAYAGLDYPFIHVDPWRGTLYHLVGGVGDVIAHTSSRIKRQRQNLPSPRCSNRLIWS
jgi:hypothetical protein